MIKTLALWAGLLIPVHHATLFPTTLPHPKPKPIVFQVGESEYDKSWKDGELTAYCNCKDVMNGETGITASGYSLDNGIYYKGYRILAGTKTIPLGTLIDIKMGSDIIHAVVLDRGGSISGTHFDIVYPDRGNAIEFGKKEMKWQAVGNIKG